MEDYLNEKALVRDSREESTHKAEPLKKYRTHLRLSEKR
jgi:hypothetical protein